MQDLFAREHNAVADMLAAKYPSLDDQELYGYARHIIAAVVAKVHTIDWTVELLKTPALSAAMNINWSGFLGLGPLALGLIGRKKVLLLWVACTVHVNSACTRPCWSLARSRLRIRLCTVSFEHTAASDCTAMPQRACCCVPQACLRTA